MKPHKVTIINALFQVNNTMKLDYSPPYRQGKKQHSSQKYKEKAYSQAPWLSSSTNCIFFSCKISTSYFFPNTKAIPFSMLAFSSPLRFAKPLLKEETTLIHAIKDQSNYLNYDIKHHFKKNLTSHSHSKGLVAKLPPHHSCLKRPLWRNKAIQSPMKGNSAQWDHKRWSFIH